MELKTQKLKIKNKKHQTNHKHKQTTNKQNFLSKIIRYYVISHQQNLTFDQLYQINTLTTQLKIIFITTILTQTYFKNPNNITINNKNNKNKIKINNNNNFS